MCRSRERSDNSVQVTMEGKKLKIQSKTRKRKDRKVTLYLPKDSILEKFSAEIGAGMVEFTEDFSAEDVEIQVAPAGFQQGNP